MDIERLPFVFVIDVDGTLVGDVTPEICITDIICQCTCENDDKVDCVLKHIRKSLAHGLARPYFVTFYKTMKEIYPESEFFIYTAASKRWTEMLIDIYEKEFDIKFNRPLFTRCYCANQKKKDIEYILYVIGKVLQDKYPTNSLYMLRRRVLLIDNNPKDYSKPREGCEYLIKCPTYSFKVEDNIIETLPLTIVQTQFQTISSLFSKYFGQMFDKSNFEIFMNQYNDYVQKHSTECCTIYKKDLFWLQLTCLIAKYDLFDTFGREIVADYEKHKFLI